MLTLNVELFIKDAKFIFQVQQLHTSVENKNLLSHLICKSDFYLEKDLI